MNREYIATADSIEAATDLALAELGVGADEVDVIILEEPGKKLFGGRKDAVVKAVVRQVDTDALTGEEAVATEEHRGTTEGVNEVEPEGVVSDELAANEEETAPDKNNQQVDISELSEEQVDEIADVGIKHLKSLVAFLGDKEITIEEFEGDEGEIILDVTGEDVGVLIGRHGRTIDALQAIVSTMTSKETGIRYPLSVDVEGYKHRRKQKVVEIAKRAAERARRSGRPVSLKAMTPQERRIVHMSLKSQDGVTSGSEGSGSYRHVVVIPK